MATITSGNKDYYSALQWWGGDIIFPCNVIVAHLKVVQLIYGITLVSIRVV